MPEIDKKMGMEDFVNYLVEMMVKYPEEVQMMMSGKSSMDQESNWDYTRGLSNITKPKQKVNAIAK